MTAIAHAEREHALLSASGAHRWLRCTPSARLEETLPDRRTSYSAAGTLGHEMAELKLRKYYTDPIGPRKFTNMMKKFRESEHYSPELEKIADTFVDYCKAVGMQFSSSPYVMIEQRVDYSHVAPGGFGTADFIAVGDDLMVIADLKTGQGKPVPIQGNEQMRLYALGALKLVAGIFPVSRVRMAIIQPKVYDEPQEDEITVEELLERTREPGRGLTLIDVRSAQEFAAGHLPGAINIPLDQIGTRAGELPADGDIVFYCQSGTRSRLAIEVLRAMGVDRPLLHFGGGMSAWQAAGQPTEPARE